MVSVSGITKLNISIFITTVLIFGTIAALLWIVLLFLGLSGTGWIALWLLISLLFLGIQWYLGPIIIKMITRAKEIPEEQSPELHNIVRRLSAIAGIPKPKLYLVEDPSPNAFAFGRTQSDSGIAVHRGLLQILNKSEVEGVLAHEIGHIKNRDVLVMTLASVLPIVLYYGVLMFGGRDRERGIGSIILVWIGALFAQFLGQLLVLWLSRTREYYADAFSAYATRNPTALMSALAKISYAPVRATESSNIMKAFYIFSPSVSEREFASEVASAIDTNNEKALVEAIEKEKKNVWMEFLLTHPLTAKRLEALLSIKKELNA